MKQFILISAIIFCMVNTYGQDWVEFTAIESTTPHYNIIKTTDTIIEFEVTIPGMYSTVIDTFNRVDIKGHSKLDSVGYPEVPVVSFLLAIPKCDSVYLDIDQQDSTEISNINIYPAPELVPDTIEGGAVALIEEFTYNRTAYETNAYFPGILAEAIDKGAIRDQNCIRVLMYPIQFNPVTKTVNAFSKFRFTLTFKNPIGEINEDVGIFNEIVGNSLINYQSNGLNASVSCGAGLADTGSVYWVTELPNQKIDTACDYLVITHQSFYTDTISRNEIANLALHRSAFNGFDVAIITTTLIEDSVTPSYYDIDEKMKQLIKNTYEDGYANNTYDGKLAYVNLFGDAFFDDSTDCVPTHSGGEDVYFTRLTQVDDTYDDYPDIMLGRCSVDDTTEVKNVVEKIINFNPFEYEYRYQYLQYCDDDERFYARTNDCFTEIVDFLPGDSVFMITPDDFDSLYPHPNWVHKKDYSLETVLEVYEKELTFFHYMGHGSYHDLQAHNFYYNSLGSNHINKLPYGFFNACHTGKFHEYDNCLCEDLLNHGSDRGMIGTVGANKQVSFSEESKMYGYRLINSIFVNSSVLGSAYFETQLNSSISIFSNTFNYFGDPALNLLYENIDSLKADIIISNITIGNLVVKPTDTISVQASISNIMGVDIDDSFVTACYAKMFDEEEYLLINTIASDSLDGFSHKTLTFDILPNSFPEGYYNLKVVVDTNNTVDELSEINNIGFADMTILNIDAINSSTSRTPNTNPISYNFTDSTNTDQLIAGNHIFDFDGNIVLKNNLSSDGYSAIGTTIIDDQKFVNLIDIQTSGVSSISSYTLDSTWTEMSLDSTYFGQSSLGFVNNSGDDYILYNDIRHKDTAWFYSLTCLDYKCNERWVLDDFAWIYDNSPEPELVRMYPPVCFYDNENSKYVVLTATEGGKIYIVEENQYGSPIIFDSINIHNCSEISNPVVVADMGFDNGNFAAVRYKHTNNSYYLALINLLTGNYDTINVSGLNCSGPFFYDLNSDGEMEVVMSFKSTGIHYFDEQLNKSQLSDAEIRGFTGFCDADNDNIPDAIYEIEDDSRYYLGSAEKIPYHCQLVNSAYI
nr:hypothetical protein [Bacteroidota bacterium]